MPWGLHVSTPSNCCYLWYVLYFWIKTNFRLHQLFILSVLKTKLRSKWIVESAHVRFVSCEPDISWMMKLRSSGSLFFFRPVLKQVQTIFVLESFVILNGTNARRKWIWGNVQPECKLWENHFLHHVQYQALLKDTKYLAQAPLWFLWRRTSFLAACWKTRLELSHANTCSV